LISGLLNAVPELTRDDDVKFNETSIFRSSVVGARCLRAPDISLHPDPLQQAKPSGDHIPLGGFVLH
jgi:hypothetical protein